MFLQFYGTQILYDRDDIPDRYKDAYGTYLVYFILCFPLATGLLVPLTCSVAHVWRFVLLVYLICTCIWLVAIATAEFQRPGNSDTERLGPGGVRHGGWPVHVSGHHPSL